MTKDDWIEVMQAQPVENTRLKAVEEEVKEVRDMTIQIQGTLGKLGLLITQIASKVEQDLIIQLIFSF